MTEVPVILKNPSPPRRAPWRRPSLANAREPEDFRVAPGDRDVAWRAITHSPPKMVGTDSEEGVPSRYDLLQAENARSSMTVKEDKMPDGISGTSLAGYGAEIYAQHHYTCVYRPTGRRQAVCA